jgi:hypothetical protein
MNNFEVGETTSICRKFISAILTVFSADWSSVFAVNIEEIDIRW